MNSRMALHLKGHLSIQVVRSASVSDADRENVISLCSRAFEEDMAKLWSIVDATHILGYFDNLLVSHAMWVTRYLQVGTGPLLRTAYVEAVATEQAYRNRGFATAIMNRLAGEIQDFDLAALSPFSVAYYERLGWELWRGPLYIRTDEGLTWTPRDGDVMILKLPRTPDLDLYAPLSAEWREGELW
jgi:aminoglycoside 2'-N-acetyltransferase I